MTTMERPRQVPSRFPTRAEVELRALEASLISPADVALMAYTAPGASPPKSLTIEGEITRRDDPSFHETIHVHKRWCSLTGEHRGESRVESRLTTQVGECEHGWVNHQTGEVETWKSPLDGAKTGSTKLRIHPTQSGMRVEGWADSVRFAAHQRQANPRVRQEGYLVVAGGYVPYVRELGAPVGQRSTSFQGKFGSMAESGTITVERSSDGQPVYVVDRTVGPYHIAQRLLPRY